MQYTALIVFAGVAVGGAVVLVLLSRWLHAKYEIEAAPEIDKNNGFVSWLQGYEHWFHKASFNNHLIFDICRVLPIFLGFCIAVISALPEEYWRDSWASKNVLVVVLTGISTISMAVVTQLRIGDLARAREIGRINCAALVVQAQLFFSARHSVEEIYDEKQRIKKEIFKIEHDQAALFAAAASAEPPRPSNLIPPDERARRPTAKGKGRKTSG
jgi:hypothetical protein